MLVLYYLAAIVIILGMVAAIYGIITISFFYIIWLICGLFLLKSLIYVIRNYKDYTL